MVRTDDEDATEFVCVPCAYACSVIRSGESFHFLISTINWHKLERTLIDSHLETISKRLYIRCLIMQ